MYDLIIPIDEAQEKSNRLAALSEAEQKAYGYLFEGYSEAWTAETLGMEKRDAKKLYAGIYKKLGVGSPRELILNYAPGGIVTIT